ncbi:hypothetical protein M1M88_01300 [Peptococcaceae bacterium]|nr:hypothetical protein [Peptococcaceae bacterium]MCL0052478.1 hypothetical protein [Peptococcaceae bacterium]
MINGPWGKENANTVEMLNQILGTKYRTKPFDLNNTNDLKEMLFLISGKYADLIIYASDLDRIIEYLDESIEIYHPVDWFNKNEVNRLINAYENIRYGLKEIEEELEETKKKCQTIWKTFTQKAPAATTKKLTGLTRKDIAKINWDALDWNEIEIKVIKKRPYTHAEAVKTIAKAIKEELT